MLKKSPRNEAELASQRDVPLRGTESAEGIASEIALRSGRHGRGERRHVDNLAPGCTPMDTERTVRRERFPDAARCLRRTRQ